MSFYFYFLLLYVLYNLIYYYYIMVKLIFKHTHYILGQKFQIYFESQNSS